MAVKSIMNDRSDVLFTMKWPNLEQTHVVQISAIHFLIMTL